MAVKRGDIAVIDFDDDWLLGDEKDRVCLVLSRVNCDPDELFKPGRDWGEIILGPATEYVRYVLWQDGQIGICTETYLKRV